MKTKTILLRISEDLKKELKLQSVREGISMSEFVTRLIQEYLSKNKIV